MLNYKSKIINPPRFAPTLPKPSRCEAGKKTQLGQTLIETLAALFILVMGVSAAVGLAVYAFSSSTSIVKEVVATGLAREGLEAVRNMRDTNWLNDTLGTVANGSNCYVYNSATSSSDCYPDWLGKNGAGGPPFCLNPSSGASCNGNKSTADYFLGFDSSTANSWILTANSSNPPLFGLNLNSGSIGNSGFYYPGSGNSGVTCVNSNSGYCREIIITKNPTSPPSIYTQDANLPLLEVQSLVWWTDKKCPAVNSWPGASKCSVELDTYLTNWKNY